MRATLCLVPYSRGYAGRLVPIPGASGGFMKTFLSMLAVAIAVSLAACGDKGAGGSGGSSPEGNWVLDVDGAIEASRPPGLAPEKIKEEDAGARSFFEMMKVTLALKGDKTFTSTSAGGGETQTIAGTWSQSGDQVTLQAKTKDGKPAEGESAKPMTLTWKGN